MIVSQPPYPATQCNQRHRTCQACANECDYVIYINTTRFVPFIPRRPCEGSKQHGKHETHNGLADIGSPIHGECKDNTQRHTKHRDGHQQNLDIH